MKTSELKEIARKNGYEFSFTGHKTVLEREGFDFKNTIMINEIYENRVWIEASRYVDDEDMDMMEAAFAYAKTALKDREKPNKYYLKHRFLYPDSYECFLNYSLYDDNLVLASKNESADYKTQFTQEEVDEIKKKFDTDLKDFEIIEVEK